MIVIRSDVIDQQLVAAAVQTEDVFSKPVNILANTVGTNLEGRTFTEMIGTTYYPRSRLT